MDERMDENPIYVWIPSMLKAEKEVKNKGWAERPIAVKYQENLTNETTQFMAIAVNDSV